MLSFGTVFCAAAITGFTQDDAFARIVPPILLFPYLIVWITGIMEIILAPGFVMKRLRKTSRL